MESQTTTPSLPTRRSCLGIVAAGFSGGQSKNGAEAAPLALIDSGLIDSLRNDLGYDICYDKIHYYNEYVPTFDPPLTTLHASFPMRNPLTVSNVTRAISDQVYENASEGRIVVTLGGDHSIAIGSIAGMAKAMHERLNGKELAVIWVDAHTDINTPETSPSGNIHGMPVSFISGLARPPKESPNVFGWMMEEHRINISNLVYIGLRDVDPGEKIIIRENGICAFSMHDIDKYGIGKVMDMALEHLGCIQGCEEVPIHLSFDIDALDPVL